MIPQWGDFFWQSTGSWSAKWLVAPVTPSATFPWRDLVICTLECNQKGDRKTLYGSFWCCFYFFPLCFHTDGHRWRSWSRIRKCSSCRQSYLDHDKRTKKCNRGKGSFTSSYSCSCNSSYDRHCTMVQTQQEREATGKATGTPWMQSAETWTELPNVRVLKVSGKLYRIDVPWFFLIFLLDNFVWCPEANAGLPTAHMGGVGGFTSLADGIDRALAGQTRQTWDFHVDILGYIVIYFYFDLFWVNDVP